MKIVEWKMTKEQHGKKIYDLLRSQFHISSTVIKMLKNTENGIQLDGKPARVIDRVKEGSILRLQLPREETVLAQCTLPVPIVYEDEDFLIFNKPAHMPVHPAHQYQEATLGNVWAYVMEKRLGFTPVFHPINRLDKDTSGLVLCAKHVLAASLDPRQVQKRYMAIVSGALEGKRGIINAPIGMEQGSKVRRAVRPDGRAACTHYECLCKNNKYSFISCELETGRTHQIRVHMAYLGHPLAGDDLYGGERDDIGRQALHCGWMRFFQPFLRNWVEVTAPLEEDMMNLLLKEYLCNNDV